jgi:acetyl-CoA C-acetyltransferase
MKTECAKALPGSSYAELVYEPLSLLMEDHAISHSEIETIITCSSDFFDGRTISDMSIQDVTGSPGKSASKVSNDATFAMLYAWMRVLSGEYENCLLVAHAKPSEGSQPHIENAAFDPLLLRHLGLTNVTASGLQARALLEAGAFTEHDFALAAAHDRRHAGLGSATLEDVLRSPVVSDPIRELEAAPYADGAACLLLASEEWISKRNAKSVTWLRGAGHCTEAHYPGERDLTTSAALRQASARAYAGAGVTCPRDELACAELSAHFSYQTPLWLRELGILEEGATLAELLERRSWEPKLNPSGGLMSGNPGFAAGLYRILEIRRRLKARQLGLAHGINGPLGQSHCVWILEGGTA